MSFLRVLSREDQGQGGATGQSGLGPMIIKDPLSKKPLHSEVLGVGAFNTGFGEGTGGAPNHHLQRRLTDRHVLSKMEPPAVSVDRIEGFEQATQAETFGHSLPTQLGFRDFTRPWEAPSQVGSVKGEPLFVALARYVRANQS